MSAPVTTAPAETTATTTEGATPDETVLGDPGKAALTAERTARKAAEKAATDYKAALQAIEDKGKTDAELATRRAGEFESRATTAERQYGQLTAALSAGLSHELAGRIQGSTAEEMLADAKALAKMFAPAPVVAPTAPAGNRPTAKLAPVATGAPTDQSLNGDPLIDALKARLGDRIR